MAKRKPKSPAAPPEPRLGDGSQGLMTVAQAAAFLAVGKTTIYRLMDSGVVPFLILPGTHTRRIPRAALVEQISKLIQQGNTNG